MRNSRIVIETPGFLFFIFLALGWMAGCGGVSTLPTTPEETPATTEPPGGAPTAEPTPEEEEPPFSGSDGQYLDRCNVPGDCVSGLCEQDVGGTSFCSRTCATPGQCAQDQICVSGVCQPDDTGVPCSVNAPQACATGLCLDPGDGSGTCTKSCSTAAECPAGYACTLAGGSSSKICVDIEKPCPQGGMNCGSGLCLSVQGCTATCQSAADCPQRLSFLAPYTCAAAFGSSQPICVPPEDILGPDAIGSTCSAVGSNTCRSGACNTGATPGPMCTQSCNTDGGCASGLGCFPLDDGGEIHLVCNRAGSKDLGESCSQAMDCHSGLCDATGFYCTRHCQDGLCPTGWSCQPIAGTAIAICRQ